MELGLGLSELLVLPLYVAAILAIVLTLTYRIEIGIFFLIPFISQQNILNYINQLPLGKDINDILFIAIIIKWVIDKVKAKESLLVKTPLNLPIFFFLGWTFLAVWWGDLYFENAVHNLKGVKHITDIRNYGLAAGFTIDAVPGEPARRPYEIAMAMLKKGFYVRYGGDTIQLAPPFITTPAQIDSLINALGETINQTA